MELDITLTTEQEARYYLIINGVQRSENDYRSYLEIASRLAQTGSPCPNTGQDIEYKFETIIAEDDNTELY